MAAESGREEPGQFHPQRRGVGAAPRGRAKREIAARKTDCLMLKAGQCFHLSLEQIPTDSQPQDQRTHRPRQRDEPAPLFHERGDLSGQ